MLVLTTAVAGLEDLSVAQELVLVRVRDQLSH